MLDCCIAKKLNRIMPECRYTMTANGLRLCEEADFGAQNCQPSTKVDAR